MNERRTEFRDTMDPRSREIVRDGKVIGRLLWHGGNPQVAWDTHERPLMHTPIDLLRDVVRESDRIVDREEHRRPINGE
jgi:hypothetical protein